MSARRGRRSVTAAATRWWPRSVASILTYSGSGLTIRGLRGVSTSAPAASRLARSPKRSSVPSGGYGTLKVGVSDPSIVRFRAVVEAGLASLEARREEVNDLNVFPVADGDTGDNMVLTLRAVLQELDRLTSASAGRTIEQIDRDAIVASVARAAPLRARGHSGVILSLLIRGAA